MIDTLARHVAALSEARRLTAMILINNGTFGLWRRSVADGDLALAGQYETELSGDKIFQAYRLLGAALAEVQPRSVAQVAVNGPVRLAERISLLSVAAAVEAEPCVACANGTKDAAACCGERMDAEPVAVIEAAALSAETSLGARLNRVLELTAMADREAVAPVWTAQHDEARVSIVYKDVPAAAAKAGEAKRPGLVSLFR